MLLAWSVLPLMQREIEARDGQCLHSQLHSPKRSGACQARWHGLVQAAKLFGEWGAIE